MTTERRLAAIMFTDVVGYSALTQRDEAAALELLEAKRQLLTPLLSQHQGSLIKTMGDGFLVEFASALQAVKCAVAIQNTLRGYNTSQPNERKLKLRIGIHLGDVEHRAGDVFGDGVNIASRIEPLAEPGGICISQQVYDQVQGKLESEFESLGTPPLKNIATPIEAFKILLPWSRPHSHRSPQAPESPSYPPPTKSIAVLPFQNMSSDPENEYFSDGITEDIITQLSKIHDLKVISRTSAMQYKQTTKKLRQIGQELDVRTILEGSVRKAGEKVRITAQLIDAQTDAHLWAENYDRRLTDIFEIQSDVAQQIASALQAHVSPQEKARIEQAAPDNFEVYNLVLQGRYFQHQEQESWGKAIGCFEQALALDPDCAPAWAGLADVYSALAGHGVPSFAEGFARAREAALKAIELDEALAEGYVSLGIVKHHYDWQWQEAEAVFQKAIELKPGLADAHRCYGELLAHLGRFDQAIELVQRALTLDPLALPNHRTYRNCLRLARRYDEALEAQRKIAELDPHADSNHFWLGVLHFYHGRHEQALAEFERVEEPRMFLVGVTLAQAALGHRAEAEDALQKLIEDHGDTELYQIALLAIHLGQLDRGFEWLERAYEQRDTGMVYLKVEPGLLDGVRSDPRYVELLKQMGLAS